MTFHATELPMVAPPAPRLDAHTGGYLIHPTEVVRLGELPTDMRQHYMSEVNKRLTSAKPLFDSLNLLSSTPWIVSRAFRVELIVFYYPLQKCWNVSGEQADIGPVDRCVSRPGQVSALPKGPGHTASPLHHGAAGVEEPGHPAKAWIQS